MKKAIDNFDEYITDLDEPYRYLAFLGFCLLVASLVGLGFFCFPLFTILLLVVSPILWFIYCFIAAQFKE